MLGPFGKSSGTAPFQPTEAPKAKSIDKGKAVIVEETPRSPPKKRAFSAPNHSVPQKCPKVTDPLAEEFFSKAAPLIKDFLVRNWDSHEEDTAHEAMVRASSELLFHSLKERAVVHNYMELLDAAEENEKKYLQEVGALKKQLSKLQAAFDSNVQAIQKANQALESYVKK